MRDLERLQDVVEYRVSPSQLRLVFFGVLAVACALFAVGVSVGKRLEPPSSSLVVDPLAQLDRAASPEEPEEESAEQPPALTYHSELTSRPQEAQERQRSSEAVPAAQASAAATGGRSAQASTAQAPSAASSPRSAPEAEIPNEPARPEQPTPGESSIFTLQVASFETREEAQQFASDLRSRSHSVFLVRTSTPERGTWFRVRVGPFHSRREATRYQARFERTERLPTFLVQRRSS